MFKIIVESCRECPCFHEKDFGLHFSTFYCLTHERNINKKHVNKPSYFPTWCKANNLKNDIRLEMS